MLLLMLWSVWRLGEAQAGMVARGSKLLLSEVERLSDMRFKTGAGSTLPSSQTALELEVDKCKDGTLPSGSQTAEEPRVMLGET